MGREQAAGIFFIDYIKIFKRLSLLINVDFVLQKPLYLPLDSTQYTEDVMQSLLLTKKQGYSSV